MVQQRTRNRPKLSKQRVLGRIVLSDFVIKRQLFTNFVAFL